MTGKPLAELRTEVELGLEVYRSTPHWVRVAKVDGRYLISEQTPVDEPEAQGAFNKPYETFDTLLEEVSKVWPQLALQPLWSISKTSEPLVQDTRTSTLQAIHALTYLANIAVREAVQQAYKAIECHKLSAEAQVSMDKLTPTEDGLMFSFILFDTLHPKRRVDITLAAHVTHIEACLVTDKHPHQALIDRMSMWGIENSATTPADDTDPFLPD
jgi:hypothetical protein